MESMGKISAQIAHEIKNPLTNLQYQVLSLKPEGDLTNTLQDDDFTKNSLEKCQTEINRIKKIISGIEGLSRVDFCPEEHCIDALVTESVKYFKTLSRGHKIEFSINLASNQDKVCETRSQIQQVP